MEEIKPGDYWFMSFAGDIYGPWELIRVNEDKTVSRVGDVARCPLSDLHGQFSGPLQDPRDNVLASIMVRGRVMPEKFRDVILSIIKHTPLEKFGLIFHKPFDMDLHVREIDPELFKGFAE